MKNITRFATTIAILGILTVSTNAFAHDQDHKKRTDFPPQAHGDDDHRDWINLGPSAHNSERFWIDIDRTGSDPEHKDWINLGPSGDHRHDKWIDPQG